MQLGVEQRAAPGVELYTITSFGSSAFARYELMMSGQDAADYPGFPYLVIKARTRCNSPVTGPVFVRQSIRSAGPPASSPLMKFVPQGAWKTIESPY